MSVEELAEGVREYSLTMSIILNRGYYATWVIGSLTYIEIIALARFILKGCTDTSCEILRAMSLCKFGLPNKTPDRRRDTGAL